MSAILQAFVITLCVGVIAGLGLIVLMFFLNWAMTPRCRKCGSCLTYAKSGKSGRAAMIHCYRCGNSESELAREIMEKKIPA